MFGKAAYDIALVRRFRSAPMRTRAFNFETAFSSYLSGATATSTNVPDSAPVDQPRFIIDASPKTLVATGNAVQLFLKFEAGLPSGRTLEDVLEKPAKEMDRLDGLLEDVPVWYGGIVVTMSLPWDGDQTQIARQIVEELYPHSAGSDVTTFSGNLSFTDGKFQRLTEISMFRTFEFKGLVAPNQTILIDPDFDAPAKEGIQLKYDVNTKPQIQTPKKGTFSEIVGEIRKHRIDDQKRFLGTKIQGLLHV